MAFRVGHGPEGWTMAFRGGPWFLGVGHVAFRGGPWLLGVGHGPEGWIIAFRGGPCGI